MSRQEAGDGFRAFCGSCGSRIYNGATSETGFITLIVSTLDDDGHGAPVLHLNVESKAAWHEIEDGLPQYDSFSREVVEYLGKISSE